MMPFKKKSTRKIPTYIILSFIVLFMGHPAFAAIFTVGTAGTYSTIQSAVTAATASPGSHEIRVRPGTYYENIYISATVDLGTLNITGGWNETFSVIYTDYTLTAINGSGTGRVFWIDISSTGNINLTLDGFTLTNGGNNTYGSGILIEARNESQITIHNNRILNNVSGDANSIAGAGIYAYCDASGNLVLNISNNLIEGNSISSSSGSCGGAGMDLAFWQDAIFNVTGNIFEKNSSTSNFSSLGAGTRIYKAGAGACDFSNNIIRDNTTNGTGARQGIGSSITITGSSTLTLHRNQWLNNINYGGNAAEDLFLLTSDTSTIAATDSLIAGAGDNGVGYYTNSVNSTIRMTNLTITDNAGYGLRKTSSSTTGIVSLYNTILYNNGTNYDTLPGDTGNNLIGSDPIFADPAIQDYRLRAGSSAINAGTNTPSGGLGSLDVLGNPRIIQSTVDIGAYEFRSTANPGVLLLLTN